MEVKVQVFEEEYIRLLKPVIHSHIYSYRPLSSLLLEPIEVLHCDQAKCIPTLRYVRGSWSNINAIQGYASASRTYSARIGFIKLSNTPIYLFRDGELIEETKTDKDGKVTFTFPSNEPTYSNYTVSLLRHITPFKTQFQDSFKFSVWLITCNVTNRTDIWWRFVGRSFTGNLPRIFWREAPHTVIGLSAPYGTQSFIDIIPLFGDLSITVEYGVSAWCNTPEPYPTREKCIAYRRNTWWRFEVTAYNKNTSKTASADLNLDRHLRVTFKTDDISYEVVRPEGAET